jgi:hypothetical protein
VKNSSEKLGFGGVSILIMNLRLCCLVLKNDLAFEPCGKMDVCFMVLFWFMRWKIFMSFGKYFLRIFELEMVILSSALF